jgi:hypothetical protein
MSALTEIILQSSAPSINRIKNKLILIFLGTVLTYVNTDLVKLKLICVAIIYWSQMKASSFNHLECTANKQQGLIFFVSSAFIR